jgi:hypothetical protein
MMATTASPAPSSAKPATILAAPPAAMINTSMESPPVYAETENSLIRMETVYRIVE